MQSSRSVGIAWDYGSAASSNLAALLDSYSLFYLDVARDIMVNV